MSRHFIQKEIETISKILALSLVIFYSLGFVVWNMYLSLFGHFEYDIFQTRFILSGILAAIWMSFIIPVFLFFWMLRRYFKGLTVIYIGALFLFVISIFWLHIFAWSVFPVLPQSWGGGKPYVKRIIADHEEIKFLQELSVGAALNGDHPPIESVPVCELYSNKEIVILGVGAPANLRALILNKNNFKGMQSTEPFSYTQEKEDLCKFFRV